MSGGLRGAPEVSDSQVSGGDVVPCDNRLLERNNLVRTEVRVEVRLDVLEERNRPVGTSTTELPTVGNGGGNTNGVVEGQTERLVDLLAALATVEQVLLDVVADGEKSAAGCVGSSVYTIRAGNPAGDGTCKRRVA